MQAKISLSSWGHKELKGGDRGDWSLLDVILEGYNKQKQQKVLHLLPQKEIIDLHYEEEIPEPSFPLGRNPISWIWASDKKIKQN